MTDAIKEVIAAALDACTDTAVYFTVVAIGTLLIALCTVAAVAIF